MMSEIPSQETTFSTNPDTTTIEITESTSVTSETTLSSTMTTPTTETGTLIHNGSNHLKVDIAILTYFMW